MTKKGREMSGAPGEGAETRAFPLFDAAEFSKVGNRNLKVAAQASRACYKGGSKLGQEVMNFFGDRVRKDFDAAKHFFAAKSSEEAFHTHAAFIEETIRDYAEQASRVLHMTADIAHETLSPIEDQTEEVLREFDKKAGRLQEEAEPRTAAE